MLDLLIAILIALGCTVESGSTAEELKSKDPASFERAQQILDSGTYKTTDGGGVVIIQGGGD